MNLSVVSDINLPDILLISYNKYEDDRGFLYEVFNNESLSCLNIDFIQEKCAYSKYGVLRGLHFQKEPYAQGKLVRCSVGSIFDIAVDIRRTSSTFGKSVGHILSEDNNLMMYIPPGFAHGVLSISNNGSLFHYFTTNHYSKEYETGLLWSDPSLDLKLPIPYSDIVLSDKDKELPKLENL